MGLAVRFLTFHQGPILDSQEQVAVLCAKPSSAGGTQESEASSGQTSRGRAVLESELEQE